MKEMQELIDMEKKNIAIVRQDFLRFHENVEKIWKNILMDLNTARAYERSIKDKAEILFVLSLFSWVLASVAFIYIIIDVL